MPGAGRPKGTPNRPQLRNYFTEAELKEMIEFLKDNMKEDARLMIWACDQIFGKAQSFVDHTTKGDKMPTPLLHVLYNDSNEENSGAQEAN